MSEKELLLAKRHDALNQQGTLKNGYQLIPNCIGKDGLEVVQLVKFVIAETRYGNGIFYSRVRQTVVGQFFV